ncbi:MAG: hypothetical protein ACXVSJ_09690 [Solirubrobacteraceae bacterium]
MNAAITSQVIGLRHRYTMYSAKIAPAMVNVARRTSVTDQGIPR